jgi:hypothetical protein
MTQIDPLTFGLAYLPIHYLSVFAHEVGHALAGRAAGYVVTSLGLGFARPLCVFRIGGVRVFLCAVKPHGGVTFAFHPRLLPSRPSALAMLSGGILSNCGLALAGLALLRWADWGRDAWLALFLVNGWQAIGSLVPFRFRVGKAVLQSDGALILQTLRSGTYHQPPTATVQGVEVIQALSSSIGDRVLSHASLLAGAEAWVDLEDFERADALLARAATQPDCEMPAIRGLGGCVRAQIALGAGRLDDAEAEIDAAATAFRSGEGDVGTLLVSLQRIEARFHRGDASGAACDLESLRSDPLVRGRPALGLAAVVLRLAAAIAADDPPEVERLLGEYETLRRKLPSATRDLKTYRAVARFHARRGDRAAAWPAYRRVLASIVEIADSWADPAESVRFLDRHRGLAEEARLCLASLGRAEEADRLVAPILAPENPMGRRAEAVRLRDRRLRGIGLRIMLVNVVVLAFAAWAVLSLPARDAVPFFVLAMLLALFTLTGALYLAFDLTLGRLVPLLRGTGGAVILILACCPWLIGMMSILFNLLKI